MLNLDDLFQETIFDATKNNDSTKMHQQRSTLMTMNSGKNESPVNFYKKKHFNAHNAHNVNGARKNSPKTATMILCQPTLISE